MLSARNQKVPESELNFSGWLNRNTSFFYTQFIAFLGFIGVVLEVILHLKDVFKDGVAPVYRDSIIGIFLLQQLFIIVVIFILNRKSFSGTIHIGRYEIYHKRILNSTLTNPEKEAAKMVSRLNTRIFGRYWFLFWKWIFLLYILLFARYIIGDSLNQYTLYTISANVLETFLNSFSMVYVFICFLLLQSPINSLDYNPDSVIDKMIGFFNNRDLSLAVVKGFSIVHLFSLTTYLLLKNRLQWTIDADILADLNNFNMLFKASSGIFNCVALALLIARLDSKIINVPSNLISVLILYAAVQPLYAYFDDPKELFVVMCVSAFTLACKVYFYLIVAFIIKTGRLGDLFMTFPMIKMMVEKEGYHKGNGSSGNIDTSGERVEKYTWLLNYMELELHAAGFRAGHFRSNHGPGKSDKN